MTINSLLSGKCGVEERRKERKGGEKQEWREGSEEGNRLEGKKVSICSVINGADPVEERGK